MVDGRFVNRPYGMGAGRIAASAPRGLLAMTGFALSSKVN